MGGCLRASKAPEYFTKPTRPTQPPTLSWTVNEYKPKCSGPLRLRRKGRYGPFYLWIKTDNEFINTIIKTTSVCDVTQGVPGGGRGGLAGDTNGLAGWPVGVVDTRLLLRR